MNNNAKKVLAALAAITLCTAAIPAGSFFPGGTTIVASAEGTAPQGNQQQNESQVEFTLITPDMVAPEMTVTGNDIMQCTEDEARKWIIDNFDMLQSNILAKNNYVAVAFMDGDKIRGFEAGAIHFDGVSKEEAAVILQNYEFLTFASSMDEFLASVQQATVAGIMDIYICTAGTGTKPADESQVEFTLITPDMVTPEMTVTGNDIMQCTEDEARKWIIDNFDMLQSNILAKNNYVAVAFMDDDKIRGFEAGAIHFDGVSKEEAAVILQNYKFLTFASSMDEFLASVQQATVAGIMDIYICTAGTLTRPEVSAPTAIAELTYTGLPQALIEPAATTGGTLKYALTEADAVPTDDAWSEELPTAINAGDYSVWYKVEGNDEYCGTEKRSVPVSIAKAQPEMYVTLNKDKVTTDDVLTEDDFIIVSSVPGSTVWENLNSELSEGETALAWTFTPDDPNYAVTTGTIVFNVETPEIVKNNSFTLTDVQYDTTYDLSSYDFEHICGVSLKFTGQSDATTNGCVVLGNYVSASLMNNFTVTGDTIDIAIDQYSLPSAIDSFTVYDWYNTAATLGDIESVTFYYTDDEETVIDAASTILYNSDNETADVFDLSEYDYSSVKSVTLVFDGITYDGKGAVVTGGYNDIIFDFDMNRTNSYSVTVDVNGKLTDTMSFSNYWNLKGLSYIALNR